ncbi:hypothetical protein ARMGADRAFT_1034560 [Armillaria gallica]|uniref:Uncharacterized protein n=1 Tax=Armillaria gallica TaxID=47427 RepID=A0A2H3CX91_ARMGA|nr:hypothetical protein ARMGADRAFT_1034560 [Armillaria gallica]
MAAQRPCWSRWADLVASFQIVVTHSAVAPQAVVHCGVAGCCVVQGRACWGRGLVIRGSVAQGREVGTPGNGDIVPKLPGRDTGIGPDVVIGDWADGSNILAHIKSPDMGSESGMGEGESVEEVDDWHVPSGRGRSPSLQISQLTHDLFFVVDPSEVVDWNHISQYGCDNSGWELLEWDAIRIVSRGGGSSDCGVYVWCPSCSSQPVLYSYCDDEGGNEKGGTWNA